MRSSFFPGSPFVMKGSRFRSRSFESTGSRSKRLPSEATSLRTAPPSTLTPSGIFVPGFALRACATAFFA